MNKMTIQKRITIWFLIFAALLTLGMGIASYFICRKSVELMYLDRMVASAETIASMISGDKVTRYYKTKAKDDNYRSAYEDLQKLKDLQDVEYLYVFVPDEKKMTYIYDVYIPGDNASLISDLGDTEYYTNQEVADEILGVFREGKATSKFVFADDRYGYLASAYAPIFDSNGNVCALLGVDILLGSILSSVNHYVVYTYIAIFTFVFLFLSLLWFVVRKTMVVPIEKLSDSAKAFVENGEKIKFKGIDVKASGEIKLLSDSFNKMAADLGVYIENLATATSEKERIKTELNVARRLQRAILPNTFPAYPNRSEFDIYALMRSARRVGGDFYDFFLLGEDKLAVVIADVSGKGIPAALLMMSARTIIKNQVMIAREFSEIMDIVNNQVCENNDTNMFITVFLGVLDLNTGEFNYANAGHNPPLIKRENTSFEWLDVKSNFVLGGVNNTHYTAEKITLHKGDTIFLYTDGVTEAFDKNDELYSASRLQKELRVSSIRKGASPKDHIEYIIKSVDAFSAGTEQSDDITMLALRYFGK